MIEPSHKSAGGLTQHVLSSLRWTASTKVIGQLVNWAITLLVIRLLLPSDYGLLAMANIVIGLLAMVGEMGFGASIVQSTKFDRRIFAEIFGATLAINVGICAALIAIAPSLAAFFDEPRLTLVVRILSLQFVIGAAALLPDALLRRGMHFRSLSIIDISSSVAGNALTLSLAYLKFGVWALVFGGLGAALLRTLILHALASDHIAPRLPSRGASQLISFGTGVTVTRLLSYLFLQADLLLVGKLLGKEALGLYSVAVHLATLPMQRAASIVNDVAFSAFARIREDRAAVSQNLQLAIRLAALFSFPVLWGFASVAPDLVPIVMGTAWHQAILPMQIIALAVPIRIAGSLVNTTTLSIGRVDIAMVTIGVGVLFAVPLYYVATAYGIVGVAVASASLAPLMVLVNLKRLGRELSVTTLSLLAEMVRPALAALIMLGAVYTLRAVDSQLEILAHLLAEIAVGFVGYMCATILFNRTAALAALQLLAPRWFGRLRPSRARP